MYYSRASSGNLKVVAKLKKYIANLIPVVNLIVKFCSQLEKNIAKCLDLSQLATMASARASPVIVFTYISI